MISEKTLIDSTHPGINDLVNTTLEVRFDYEKSYLHEKIWLTQKPHFYNTDPVSLDAKLIENIAKNDEKRLARAAVIDALATTKNPGYPICMEPLQRTRLIL